MTTQNMLIIGAGQAGAMAAKALRDFGYAGSISMVGKELHFPYERPPLSKAMLQIGTEPHTEILSDESCQKLNIEVRRGLNVVGIDAGVRTAQLESGEVVGFDRCLLATGGRPRGHPLLPAGMNGVHYIRTLDDARRLRGELGSVSRMAVIGGGFLGLEIASSARARGVAVTVLENAPGLLRRFLPLDASVWLESWLRSSGVELHLGHEVTAVQRSASNVFTLSLSDGDSTEADIIVVAIGLVPNTRLAVTAGLSVDERTGGILVDETCRTSSPFVFAAGDCASQVRLGDSSPARIESWQNANEQAKTAAAGMLGKCAPSAAYPWFWTDQGPHNIQVLGSPSPDLVYLRRGKLLGSSPEALWVGHRGGVPLHAVALNSANQLRAIRGLLERGVSVDFSDFADSPNIRQWASQVTALGTHPPASKADCQSAVQIS